MSNVALAYNVVDGEVKSELPFKTFSFTQELNRPGQFNIELPVCHDPDSVFEKCSESVFAVNNTAIIFLRDGVPLFAGYVEQESSTISEDSETVRISGPDVSVGYLHRRVLYFDYTPTSTDQFTIAEALVETFANTNGIGLDVVYSSLSGVTRDRTYYGRDRHNIGKLFDDLASVENGFDFIGQVTGSQASGFNFEILLGHPSLNRRTGLVLSLAKNISTITKDVDGKSQAFAISAKSGTGRDSLVALAVDTEPFGSYPQLDEVISKNTVTNVSTLEGHARHELEYRSRPIEELMITVNPDDPDSQVGAFRAGDEFRVIAKRGRFDVDGLYRVTRWTFMADADGTERMTMSMTPTERTS